MTADKVIRVSSSTPFATLIINCRSHTNGAICFAVLLVYIDGTANTTASICSIACFKSVVKTISSERCTPGNLSLCSCCSFSICISDSRIDQSVTACPFFCSTTDNAVPQLPAPTIPMFAIFLPLPFLRSLSPVFLCHYLFSAINALFSVPFNSLFILD